MDEAQNLADRVAILAAGRVVAAGTPDSLGGRDEGEALIAFRLPAGVSLDDLPPGLGARPLLREDRVELRRPSPPGPSTPSPAGRWPGARSWTR